MICLDSGQRFDSITQEMQPWYTHPALDEIQSWDLQNKVVLEWGGGYSTLWWARRCRAVFTIEVDRVWREWIIAKATSEDIRNIKVVNRASNASVPHFTDIPDGCSPDIAVVDGVRRLECLIKAQSLRRPVTVIYDNWQKFGRLRNNRAWMDAIGKTGTRDRSSFSRSASYLCPDSPLEAYAHVQYLLKHEASEAFDLLVECDLIAEAIMQPYLGVSYAQVNDSADVDGWQTAIWHLTHDGSSSLPNSSSHCAHTVQKLRHDLKQLAFPQENRSLNDESSSMSSTHRAVISGSIAGTGSTRASSDARICATSGNVRAFEHAELAPRVRQSLSNSWTSYEVGREYYDSSPGLAVIDDFLSAEALESLRIFCLESTIWSSGSHSRGRLGTDLRKGAYCPLVAQIAEETQQRLVNVISGNHRLAEILAVKNSPREPGNSNIHANFADVSVIFWITQCDANLHENNGGLVVYSKNLPGREYADDGLRDGCPDYLSGPPRRQAGRWDIGYRENRAVVLTSGMFYGDAELKFRLEYNCRLIAITMLYGEDGLGSPQQLVNSNMVRNLLVDYVNKGDDRHGSAAFRGLTLRSRRARFFGCVR